MRSTTSAPTAIMTNVRIAIVSLISIGDFDNPQPIEKRPRLNTGRANIRFHQSNSAGKSDTSRAAPGAKNNTRATAIRYMPWPRIVRSLLNGAASFMRAILGRTR